MQHFENYIWDLGGTLLDNYESSSRAFAATLWEMTHRVLLHTDAYAALRVSTDFAVQTYAADVDDFLKEYKQNEALALSQPILFDGAREVLAQLKNSGSRQFMISHRDKQVLEILSAAGILDYFTEVVTADNGFPRKPAPDSINYLLEKYQLTADKTVMIGDRALDIEAGNAAGVKTIAFSSDENFPDADATISTLKELL